MIPTKKSSRAPSITVPIPMKHRHYIPGKTGINVGITMSICSSGSETLYITGCAKSAAGKDFKINKSFCVGPGTRVYHICGIESAQDFDDNFDIIKQIDWKITDKDRNVLFCGSSDNNIYHVPTSAPEVNSTRCYMSCAMPWRGKNMEAPVQFTRFGARFQA